MGDERQVSKWEGELMARKYGMNYRETSAKDNIGINNLLENAVRSAAERLIEQNESIRLDTKISKNRKICCK